MFLFSFFVKQLKHENSLGLRPHPPTHFRYLVLVSGVRRCPSKGARGADRVLQYDLKTWGVAQMTKIVEHRY